MTLFDVERASAPYEVAPGAVHLPGWLSPSEQRRLVTAFETWAAGPVPIRSASVRGHPMSVKTVCLGWHWQPYRYTRHAGDVNGERVLPLPDWLVELGRRALTAVGWTDPDAYRPDTALINFYDAGAKMGLHQDKDEVSPTPPWCRSRSVTPACSGSATPRTATVPSPMSTCGPATCSCSADRPGSPTTASPRSSPAPHRRTAG